jgi:uncharacterized MAPEG superfamily protein
MTIENIVLLTCLLVLVQILTPTLIDFIFMKKLNLLDLSSSRDDNIDNSIYFERGKRAFSNLSETLPIFILLMFLSINKDIDNLNLAALWLTFRLFYFPIYILGINFVRTLVWFGALVCLIMMGLKFL